MFREFIRFVAIPAVVLAIIAVLIIEWLTPLCTTEAVLMGVCA